MKNFSVIVLTCLVLLGSSFSLAGDLVFPKTQAEIVQALSIKDGRTTYNGEEYISQSGKVYKIIGGKRFQMRGLEAIVDSDITPRAGALIHFDFDSARIRPESYPLLNEFGQALKGDLSEAVVMVAGHADYMGTEAYNMDLSERRAEAVKEYLVETSMVEVDRLMVKAYGENRPIASNETEEGRALNRRVEFIRVGGF